MSASSKLLYILPDVVYVVELLPAKSPANYEIHNFRQINGKFINEDEFLTENLEKLLDKLEPGEYQVVLPDFLFTDTILDVKATNETQVKDYIKTKLLPSLGIDRQSHQIEAFVLTERHGVYKLQLSALEKSLLAPLAQGMADRALLTSGVTSVSWALKSVISLEPSVSIVQLGEQLYLAEQYIGVDQTVSMPVAEAENLVDTIKTLKGAEPSLQTIYLLTSESVAEKLRQGLHDSVPLQQLAKPDEAEAKMPSYLKLALEVSMKTLATPDYQLPKFDLSSSSSKPAQALNLPIEIAKAVTQAQVSESVSDEEVQTEPAKTKPVVEITDLPKPMIAKLESTQKVIDLAQPSSKESTAKPAVATKVTPSSLSAQSEIQTKKTSTLSNVIKNKSDINGLMKLIAIGVGSFIVTVGIGIGVGLALVFFTNNQIKPNSLLSAIVTPSPVLSETPTPTVTQTQLDPAKLKILVVNATTISGYAGKVAEKLKAAGFGQVKTNNAAGEYDPGTYLLIKTADPALLELIKSKTELTELTAKTDSSITVEDAKAEYTAVVVLAK